MAASIFIEGAGLLANYVSDLLSVQFDVTRHTSLAEIPKETEFVLVLHDAWRPSLDRKAEETLRTKGIPWLRAFVSFGEGVIGPIAFPDRPGCSVCADVRRLIAGPDRREMWELQNKLALVGGLERDAWSSRTGLSQLTLLINREVERFLRGETTHLEDHVFITNLRTLET